MSEFAAPPLVLEPWTPPAGGPARAGKPKADEDAWNRYAAAGLQVETRIRTAARLGRIAEHVHGHRLAGASSHGAEHLAGLDHASELELGAMVRGLSLERLERQVEILEGCLEGRTVPGLVAAERRRLEVELELCRAELDLRAADRVPASKGAALILTSRKSTTRCENQKASLFRCGCQGKLHYVGCERTSCVRCAPRVTIDRAKRVFRKLTASLDAQRAAAASKDPRLYAVRVSVLTMPESEREKWTDAPSWTRLRRRVWHLLRDEFNASWACITTHPVGDQDPRNFHPHLNVLWAKRGIARGFMPPEELERLKLRWAELLGVEGPVDVHGSFVQRPDEKRLHHRARYYARVFVGWKSWIPKAVQWFGDFARSVDPIPCTCEECGKPFQVVAWGDRAVQLYLHLAETCGLMPMPPPPASENGRRRS
jgi:hypothetical protein